MIYTVFPTHAPFDILRLKFHHREHPTPIDPHLLNPQPLRISILHLRLNRRVADRERLRRQHRARTLRRNGPLDVVLRDERPARPVVRHGPQPVANVHSIHRPAVVPVPVQLLDERAVEESGLLRTVDGAGRINGSAVRPDQVLAEINIADFTKRGYG